ncbi:MAG: hypothetical protein MJ016_07665 [Victivallaceae bacterium]|nr:hypothetical protein [Victivallaceae bacterium]
MGFWKLFTQATVGGSLVAYEAEYDEKTDEQLKEDFARYNMYSSKRGIEEIGLGAYDPECDSAMDQADKRSLAIYKVCKKRHGGDAWTILTGRHC